MNCTSTRTLILVRMASSDCLLDQLAEYIPDCEVSVPEDRPGKSVSTEQ